MPPALTLATIVARGEEMKASRLKSVALSVVERQVRHAFPEIGHMSPAELAALLQRAPEQVVLLDVRTRDEVSASRLPGAIAAAPETQTTYEIAHLAGTLEGKIVVAYCAIGMRSARLLARIGPSLREKGVRELHNLEGGLFRWRNEGRSLVDGRGSTRAIQAYNVLWRRFLLDDPDVRD